MSPLPGNNPQCSLLENMFTAMTHGQIKSVVHVTEGPGLFTLHGGAVEHWGDQED